MGGAPEETYEVELTGGPWDGTILKVDRLDRPIYLSSRPTAATLTDENLVVPMFHVVTYVSAGWSETSRRWVYALDAG